MSITYFFYVNLLLQYVIIQWVSIKKIVNDYIITALNKSKGKETQDYQSQN